MKSTSNKLAVSFAVLLLAVWSCLTPTSAFADKVLWTDQAVGREGGQTNGQDAEGNPTTTIYHGFGAGKTVTTYEKETGIPKHKQSYDSNGELEWEEFYDTEDGFTRKITYPGSVETTYTNRDIREQRGDYEDAQNSAKRWDEFSKQIDDGVQGLVDQFTNFISGGSIGIKKPSGDKAPKLDPNPPWGVYDPSEFESFPVRDTNPKPALPKPDPKGRPWGFLPEYNPKDKEADKDAGSMPLAEHEHLAPEPEKPTAPDGNQTAKPSGFFNYPSSLEPEVKEIDYNKYGDQLVFDASRGTTSVLNSSTGTITEFQLHPFNFGEMYGGTIAATKLNGKTIHEDYYTRDGNLTKSIDINPTTGIRTITEFNRDGTQTVARVNADGSPVVQKASTTDKDGNTITAEGNADGTKTVTVTDKDGNVVKQDTVGKDSDVLIEGSSTDPQTGVTRTGKKLKDGTTEITITDKNGKVIGTEVRNASGKLMSQKSPRSAGDSFSRFDTLSSPMSQLQNMTPTAALDGGFARNMGGETGTIAMGSSNSKTGPNHPYDS